MLTLLAEKMVKELSSSKGFLIDGYPREKAQGELFEQNVSWYFEHQPQLNY